MPAPALTAPPARPAAPAEPLGFDDRLALAALAVDARIQTTGLDLADVIRLPVELPAPEPPPCPYTAPVAACLWRAARRIEAGWCTGRLRDEQGRVCLIGAIRAEAPGGGVADDACRVLLDAIRREFGPDVETVPAANDHLVRDGHMAARLLDEAAADAA